MEVEASDSDLNGRREVQQVPGFFVKWQEIFKIYIKINLVVCQTVLFYVQCMMGKCKNTSVLVEDCNQQKC